MCKQFLFLTLQHLMSALLRYLLFSGSFPIFNNTKDHRRAYIYLPPNTICRGRNKNLWITPTRGNKEFLSSVGQNSKRFITKKKNVTSEWWKCWISSFSVLALSLRFEFLFDFFLIYFVKDILKLSFKRRNL